MTTFSHIHFESIDSTNSWAKENIGQLNRENLTLITAGEQIQGRGQWNRSWASPPGGNLYCSLCYFIEANKNSTPLSQILALALCQVLEGYSGEPKIKWPNDILLEGKKCGGILTETVEKERHRLIIHGLGLNLTRNPSSFSDGRVQPVTDLSTEQIPVPQATLLGFEIAEMFLEKRQFLQTHGLTPFIADLENRQLQQPGDPLWVKQGGAWHEMVYEGLNEEGWLKTRTATGELLTSPPQEVSHTGPSHS